MTPGKFLLAAGAALSALAMAASAQAGTVVVSGDRYNLNVINNFYNSYGGNTSSIAGSSIAGADLSHVDLLWAVQPNHDYSAGELSTMASYLSQGGRIAFMGEHGGFAPQENNRISAALAALGSTISIVNDVIDSGFHTASVADGQILSNPLTAGVNTYEYAAFAHLNISGTAQALMLGSDLGTVMMAYQNIGAGSVFLITDQNVWDNAGSLWPGFDNEVMFQNLVTARTGAPPPPPPNGSVPEPATWAMMLLGFGFVAGAMRSRRQRARVTYAF